MRGLALAAALFASACGDNLKPHQHPDDAGIDAPATLVGCLDTPGVPLVPAGQLPCDLVPPGLMP